MIDVCGTGRAKLAGSTAIAVIRKPIDIIDLEKARCVYESCTAANYNESIGNRAMYTHGVESEACPEGPPQRLIAYMGIIIIQSSELMQQQCLLH